MRLIKEVRFDRSDESLTQLARPAANLSNLAVPLPEPAATVDAEQNMSAEKLTYEIETNFRKESTFIPRGATESLLEWCAGPRRRHVEKLHRIASSFEFRDAGYFRLFLGGSLDDYRKANQLITAIESFEFCAAVEDAAPHATGRESRSMERTIIRVVNNLPDGALNDVHFGDVCAAYFMERVGFDTDNCFGNKADYYRAMEHVRQNLDLIKPYLPVIIAVTWNGREYDTAEKLFALIDELSQYDPEQVPFILSIVRERGGFDSGAVDEALSLGTPALATGAL